jgi:peroxiredoxin Q/BCP
MKKVINFLLIGVFMSGSFFSTCLPKKLKVGDKASNFALKDENGDVRKLDEFKNKYLVLYFYPKDETPGCTKQACSLRDGYADLEKAGITILGISFDSVASHKKFKERHKLPFSLLSDKNKSVAITYGACKKIIFFYLPFPLRKTFLINKQQDIVEILDDVDVKNHASEIIAAFGIGNSNSV